MSSREGLKFVVDISFLFDSIERTASSCCLRFEAGAVLA